MLITACSTSTGSSQQGARGSASFYNPNTEITVKGTVEQVETAYLPGGGASLQARGESSGPVYLSLQADTGVLTVSLGPSWFLDSKGFKVAKGDQIEVTGSKFQDQNTIVAREVKKSDQVLVLRNSQGVPEWSSAQ
jgi:hypothetical protein